MLQVATHKAWLFCRNPASRLTEAQAAPLHSRPCSPHLQLGPGSVKSTCLALENVHVGDGRNAGTRCSKAPPAPLHEASAASLQADTSMGCLSPKDAPASPAHAAMERKLLLLCRGRQKFPALGFGGLRCSQPSPGCRVCRQQQAEAGSTWGTAGFEVHEGRETQGAIAVQEQGLAEQRERLPLGCLQEEGDEGKPRESCQRTSLTLRACAGWVGVRRAWLDTPGSRASPCPPAPTGAAQPNPAPLRGSPGTCGVGSPAPRPGERCRGERWRSCSRPLGELPGARPGQRCFPAVLGKARSSYLQTPRCHSSGHLEHSPESLQEGVWQMGQLRPRRVLGGCHSRGCSWPCKVLCPKSGFRGLEGHTGAAEQGCLQEARTEPTPAEPEPLQEQHSPLSHVGTSCPSDPKPCTSSTPHQSGTSTMKPWLPHPSFPAHAGSIMVQG